MSGICCAALAELMLHARNEVSSAATDAMLASCLTVGNRDLEPHVPAIVGCIAKAELVPEVIAKLSATTFVQVWCEREEAPPRAACATGAVHQPVCWWQRGGVHLVGWGADTCIAWGKASRWALP